MKWYLEQKSEMLKSARIYKQASTILTDSLKTVYLLKFYNNWTYKFLKLLFKLNVIAKLISRHNKRDIYSYIYTQLNDWFHSKMVLLKIWHFWGSFGSKIDYVWHLQQKLVGSHTFHGARVLVGLKHPLTIIIIIIEEFNVVYIIKVISTGPHKYRCQMLKMSNE